MPPVQRPRYFDHQFLKVEDFTLETEYHLDMRRRHNRDLHTPGVADGLTVAGSSGATSVTVAPGVALDAQGREIVLVDPRTVSLPTGVTSAQVYIVYDEEETDQVTAAGVTGNRRFSEDPAVVVSPPAAVPPDGILLATLALNNGQLTAPPNNAVRQPAASVVMDDLPLRSLVLRQDSVPPAQWPRLRCGEANLASLEGASLRLENGREIFFQDNGQIRSMDQAHRIVFNRANNRLELYEFGDIVFLTGGVTPTEKARIQASGRVGIGVPDPDAPLHVLGGNWDVGGTEGDLKIGDDTFRLKVGVALGGAGAGDVRVRAQGGTNRLMLGAGTADTLTIQGNNVGIGTITPQRRLHVEGDLSASNLFGGGTFRLGAGRTAAGSTNWQPYSGTAGIFVDVDTTAAGFTATPVYLTALHGNSNHWTTTGGTSVYTPTQTGFRIYVRWADGSPLTPAQANGNGWHIQWLGIQLPGLQFIGPIVTPGPVILDPGILKIKG